jgi:hypothetical protein
MLATQQQLAEEYREQAALTPTLPLPLPLPLTPTLTLPR